MTGPRWAVALGMLLTAGCAADSVATACPAIGWPVTLTVRVADPAVELCVDGECATSTDLADQRGPTDAIVGANRSASGWDFALTGAVDEVTVRRIDAAGAVLAERTVRPRWERTGGTPECGGPQQAVVDV